MAGEKVFEDSQYIKNNCTECKHFTSYADDYFDDMEPRDQGFCLKDKNDRYGDATITCELFAKRV